MEPLLLWLTAAIVITWLAAAPPLTESVILLPDADGKITGIVIKTGTQETAVTEPFQGVEMSGGKVAGKKFSADEIQQRFPGVMQALPEKSRTFTLRFLAGGTTLDPDSLVLVDDIQHEIKRRTAPEITVIGHTDRAGSEEINLKLSFNRAEAIRSLLVSGGASASQIQAIGRGELAPEVATEDGVDEPRNRRVEVTVR